MKALFDLQRAAFERQRQPDERLRRDRLQRLLEITRRNEADIVAAASEDFGHRAAADTLLGDLLPTLAAIRHAQRHLRRWMAPRRVPTPLHLWPGRSRVMRQPLGVVGMISPWNYPWQLALVPAAAALAAGNRVMLKPSEHTPAVVGAAGAAGRGRVRRRRAGGGAGRRRGRRRVRANCPSTTCSFTGSTAVGRKVALAAAAQPDAGDAGARRQVAGDLRRRRRPRRTGATPRGRQAAERRADLHRAGLRAGAAGSRRRVGGGV